MIRIWLILGIFLFQTSSVMAQEDVCDEFQTDGADLGGESFFYLLSKVPTGNAQKLASFAECAAELPLAGSGDILQFIHQSAELEPKALVSRINVWKDGENGAWWQGDATDGKLNINVCWTDNSESLSWEQLVVRYAVFSTWERHSRISFLGWEKCEQDHEGISIEFTSGISKSSVGVKSIEDMPSMSLSNKFQNDGLAVFDKCRNEQIRLNCLWSTSVHEFGHALAFEHEHARRDVADVEVDCYEELYAKGQLEYPGPDADTFGTAFDKKSIMNYCNNFTTHRLQLSVCDVFTVQHLYLSPTIPTYEFDKEIMERFCKVREN